MTSPTSIGLSLEEQNRIARFRLECMRRAGAMLAETVRGGGSGRGANAQLEPLGVERNDSRRWQQLARLDDDLIAGYIAECESAGAEVTHAGLLRTNSTPHTCSTHAATLPIPASSCATDSRRSERTQRNSPRRLAG